MGLWEKYSEDGPSMFQNQYKTSNKNKESLLWIKKWKLTEPPETINWVPQSVTTKKKSLLAEKTISGDTRVIKKQAENRYNTES